MRQARRWAALAVLFILAALAGCASPEPGGIHRRDRDSWDARNPGSMPDGQVLARLAYGICGSLLVFAVLATASIVLVTQRRQGASRRAPGCVEDGAAAPDMPHPPTGERADGQGSNS